jgi:16S rRNA (guanine527-N7)-methyltransferase
MAGDQNKEPERHPNKARGQAAKDQNDVQKAFRAAVAALAAEWAVPCDAAQTAALTRYASLLLAWNARINLTGATTFEVLAAEHLPDPFALASRLAGRGRVVDVGSGGGLPALPLAVLRPALEIRLVEPRAKRAAFLRTAIRELDLPARVTVEMVRGEALAEEAPGAFDVAISRATFPPALWIHLGARLVRVGGRVFALATSEVPLADAELELRFRRAYLGGRRSLVELERRV